MKKTILLLVVIAMALVGCQPEKNAPEAVSEPCFKVQVKPARANSGATTPIARIIMQVINPVTDEIVNTWTNNGPFTTNEDGLIVTSFQPELLLGQAYTFLFWADGGSAYFDASDLRAVEMVVTDGIVPANDEKRDAFYASFTTEGNYTGAIEKSVTLVRPLGQFNIKATDVTDANCADFAATEMSVTYEAATSFDVMTGIASGTATLTAVATGVGENAAFTDYIFVSEDGAVMDFAFTSTNPDLTKSFTNVPVKRNNRTNLVGSLFSATSAIEIIVNPDWDEVYIITDPNTLALVGNTEYADFKDAFTAALESDGPITIVMTKDVELDGNTGLNVPLGKNVTLNLNGHKLSNMVNENKSSQVFTNMGTLTIDDATGNGVITNAVNEGTIAGEWWSDPKANYATNVITNTGKLIVNGGQIIQTAAGSICYAVDNNSNGVDATLIINNGLIKNESKTAIRMYCNSTTKENSIIVNGGEIIGGYAGIWIQLPGSSAQAKKATLEVNGGTLRGEYAFYDYTFGDKFDATQYTLTGGTFDGYVYSYGANIDIQGGTYNGEVDINQSQPSDVTVSGGIFKEGCYCYGDNASVGYITGGTYYVEPESVAIANGYTAVQQGNTWVVTANN